jgi:hypothetical protein
MHRLDGKFSLGVVSDAVIAGYEQDLPDICPAATDLVAVDRPRGRTGEDGAFTLPGVIASPHCPENVL